METAALTINDLDLLNDDVFEGQVAPPDAYPNPIGPRPLDEGTYEMRLVKITPDRDDAGNWRDVRFPTVKCDFEVVAGAMVGRKATFVRISSRTIPRKRGAATENVSDLGDLIRAYDPEFNWGNSPNVAFRYLMEHVDKGTICKLRLGWKATDMDYLNANGLDSLPRDSQERKDLYKKAVIRGQKNFDVDGTVAGPSGKLLKAQVFLQQAYPAKVGA